MKTINYFVTFIEIYMNSITTKTSKHIKSVGPFYCYETCLSNAEQTVFCVIACGYCAKEEEFIVQPFTFYYLTSFAN